MTNLTIRQLLVVIVVFLVCLATSVAYADSYTMTVQITDAHAVERELGTCDSGFYLSGNVDGRPRSYTFYNGVAEISVRDDVHTAPSVGFACAGRNLGMPTDGVSIEMNAH